MGDLLRDTSKALLARQSPSRADRAPRAAEKAHPQPEPATRVGAGKDATAGRADRVAPAPVAAPTRGAWPVPRLPQPSEPRRTRGLPLCSPRSEAAESPIPSEARSWALRCRRLFCRLRSVQPVRRASDESEAESRAVPVAGTPDARRARQAKGRCASSHGQRNRSPRRAGVPQAAGGNRGAEDPIESRSRAMTPKRSGSPQRIRRARCDPLRIERSSLYRMRAAEGVAGAGTWGPWWRAARVRCRSWYSRTSFRLDRLEDAGL